MDNTDFLTTVVAIAPAIIIATICGELYRFFYEKKYPEKKTTKKKKESSIVLFSIILFTVICIISIFLPGNESYLIKVLVMFGIMKVCLFFWIWLSYFIRYIGKRKKHIISVTISV